MPPLIHSVPTSTHSRRRHRYSPQCDDVCSYPPSPPLFLSRSDDRHLICPIVIWLIDVQQMRAASTPLHTAKTSYLTIITSKLFLRHITSCPKLIEALVRNLDECRSTHSLPTLRAVHSKILEHWNPISNPSIRIKLMRAYAVCGEPTITRRVFDETPVKNVIFFNVMMRSYATNHFYRDALVLFGEMSVHHHVMPDNYTYPCALMACSGCRDLTCGQQIHGAVSKVGLDSNLFVGNALITMYCRCDRSYDAFRLFQGMPHRDVVSWNSMIAGYTQNGQSNQAVEICKQLMELKSPRPDAGTMASILPAMSNVDPGIVELLRRMFDGLTEKNIVSWNAMIAIYANNSMAAKAVELFSQMKLEGIEPDAVTFASVLPLCGELSALTLGNQIYGHIKSRMLFPNLVLENALMDMYANCGCLEAAREVFENMKSRDVVSWTSIISAYGSHGHGHDAIALFEQMQGSGLIPDHIAFVAILSACSYSGLLDKGKHYFKFMIEQYQLVPRIEHFACMVDLLGRAGHVEEAYDFIKRMPIEPNERVWGALLAACRVHSHMSIGLVAADHLFRLVPEQSGYYVLLSNIYAQAGRWGDVTSVRNIMVKRGMKKLPGCSHVELGNKVHSFHIGDRSHSQSKEIYAELAVLMGKMKEVGYVAETETALHDVEEEDKEGHLTAHSEKLAIVFALINTGPETIIRVTMNLRTCGDCHHAAKLISHITRREIILRDTNRFHHFANGICSCGDYW